MVRCFHTKINSIIVVHGYCATIHDPDGNNIGDHPLKGYEVVGFVKDADFNTVFPLDEASNDIGGTYRLRIAMNDTVAIMSDVVLSVEGSDDEDALRPTKPEIVPKAPPSTPVIMHVPFGYESIPPPGTR